MSKLPSYVGVGALGIKMGVVLPGSDLVQMVYEALARCEQDGFLDNGDVVCVTESVVARSQNNFVTTEDIAAQVREKLNLTPRSRLGIVFPIASRNRFSLILRGLSGAVPEGEVYLQFSYPIDEVGNQVLPEGFAESIGKRDGDLIEWEEIKDLDFSHPITGVNYVALYREIIAATGAKPHVYLGNDPTMMARFQPDGVVVADIHTREKTKQKLTPVFPNCITLQDVCSTGPAWSEWGVLGSNMSSGNRLKLAPRQASEVAGSIQARVAAGLGKQVEVIIYGDGAYLDPSTRIYELADPRPAFGMTPGLAGKYREGLKYKYVADSLHAQGKSNVEIEQILAEKMKEEYKKDSIDTEGTTPRRVEDILASLADLISGSADAGTPVVLIKGFLGSARARE